MQVLIEALFLAVAVSLDAFVSSLAYGADRIRIPLKSAFVIAVVGTATLACALLCGTFVQHYIPAELTRGLSFAFLFTLGLVKLFDSSVTAFIRKHNGLDRKISFSAFHIRFILRMYTDPVEADRDQSKLLSPKEAAPLALALSIDSVAVGFSAGLAETGIPLVSLLCLVLGFVSVLLGAAIGKKAAEKSQINLGWLAGLLLMGLGALKLIG